MGEKTIKGFIAQQSTIKTESIPNKVAGFSKRSLLNALNTTQNFQNKREHL